MTAPRFTMPFAQWSSPAGSPYPGARLYFYESETSEPLDTYSDQELTVPNTNPVVANGSGTFGSIFLQNAQYKVILKTSRDTEVWTADPVDGGLGVPTDDNVYDLPIYFEGKPTAAEVYPIFNIPRNMRLPADLEGSIITTAVFPTATAVFTLYISSIPIGTITIGTSGGVTISFLNDVNFNAGAQFSMIAPSSQDATLSGVAMTLVFTVL